MRFKVHEGFGHAQLTELAARLAADPIPWSTLSKRSCIARLHHATNDVMEGFVLEPATRQVRWLAGEAHEVRSEYASISVALAAPDRAWNEAFSGADTFQSLYLKGQIQARGGAEDLLTLSAVLQRI